MKNAMQFIQTPLLAMAWVVSGLLALAYPANAAQFSNTPQEEMWVTNGVVYGVVATSDTVYLGGQFQYVGPATGYGVPIDATSGNRLSSFPNVDGLVYACAVDGSGGWYIGGDFAQVGGVVRHRIAHILSDYTVDPSWDPNANNTVQTITISGSTMYVGGTFTGIGGQPRSNIAALDLSTGAATSWAPNADGLVRAILVSGSTVYAGGDFFNIGGYPRRCIAALDAASTGTATSWDPNSDQIVKALEISGSTLYVGGNFATIGGYPRNRIAALDTASTGVATSWNPNADGSITKMILSGTTLYAGGNFRNIGGYARNYLAAMDTASTGVATSWNPNSGGDINAMTLTGSTIYVGGRFSTMGGQPRRYLAAVDASTGDVASWNPYAGNYPCYALAASGSTVYAGGAFTSVNGVVRNNIAAFSVATGQATSWDPNASDAVHALALSEDGTKIYAGGSFVNIGGQARNRIAAVNLSTHTITAWNPNANGQVQCLDVADGLVYAGGFFTNIGGLARSRIAALNVSTHTATAWDPSASDVVYAIKVSSPTVYAGGDFSNIGGQPRNWIAALNSSAPGTATAWNPNANNSVRAFAVTTSTVYVGGFFTNVGGQSRNYIAALDAASTGGALSWNPNSESVVYSLTLLDSTLYVGGGFSSIGGVTRIFIAALDPVTAEVGPWAPEMRYVSGTGYYVHNLAFSPDASRVYAGGAYLGVAGKSRSNFTQFNAITNAPTNPGATAVGTDRITWTWTDNSSDETGFKVYDNSGTAEPTTLQTTTAADATFWEHTGLSANMQYTFQVAAVLPGGDSGKTPKYTTWTLAAVPIAPVISNPTPSTLAVAIGAGDGNSAATEYAIYCVTTLQWVQADGSLGVLRAWQTAAAWGAKTVTGLGGLPAYSFQTCARNGAGIQTANGPSATGGFQSVLTVASLSPNNGVTVLVSPNDANSQGSGVTQFTRVYASNTSVTLVAPPSAPNGNSFLKWQVDGQDFPGNGSLNVQVLMNANRTMTAVYHSLTPVLTVASLNPSSGVNISVYPADMNSRTQGATEFVCLYSWRNLVTLTAPPVAPNGFVFLKWLKDGMDFANNANRAVLCSMDTDHTMTAVFAHPASANFLTVASSDPSSGVTVAVYPADQNRRTSGTTQFMFAYSPYSLVTLTAPRIAPNGFEFVRWLKDGMDFANNTQLAVLCSMGSDHTMTVAYAHPLNTSLLTVNSLNPGSGVAIAVYPADKYYRTTGTTQFVYAYAPWTLVTLTAPPVAPNGYLFSKWLKDGADFANNTQRSVTCSLGADHVMTAVYVHPANTWLLTVASSNPNGGVTIAIYPADKNGRSAGTTQFVSPYAPSSLVTLTAPATAPNGYRFVKWLRNGNDFSNNTQSAVLCPMNADYVMTAVYQP